MVDLSQDQPLKEKPTPDVPASDQPPVSQPTAQPKKQSFTSSSQLKAEEKIATLKQEKIKKELSELGIPPKDGSKRTKVLLATLGVILLIAILPAAVYLVKQRQEMRSAACHNEGDCISWKIVACGNGTWKGKVRKKGTSSWQEEELVINDNGCHDSPSFDYNFSLTDGDWVEWEGYYNGNPYASGEYQVWNCPPEPLTCVSLGGEPDPSGLSPGDEITLTCTGSSDPTIPIDHFEFRVQIDGGEWENLGQKIYTIPSYGCYKIECRACSSGDSSECTEWGQAQ